MVSICWVYVGCMLGVCWVYVGCMLGVCWVYVGRMLGVCWAYVGVEYIVCVQYLEWDLSTGHSDGGSAESADQKFARSRMEGLGPVVQHRIIAGTYFLSYRCEKQFIVSSVHFENDIIAIISTPLP